ncbi:MAG: hypothetical protein A2W26_12035, partial [Acidobacteria bacterium RBG_16_64_8]
DLDTASSRHRLFHLLPYLERQGIRGTVLRGGKTSFSTAIRGLVLAPRVDGVFLQKKLLPAWYLAVLRGLARTIVFDFDDALYAPRSLATQDQLQLARRLGAQLDRMFRAVGLGVAGNEVLAEYSRLRSRNVVVVPTTFLAEGIEPKRHAESRPTVIGWIGSEGTLLYLDMLIPVFESLAAAYGSRIVFRIVSNSPFAFAGLENWIENIPWSRDREAELLSSFDIGVMPLLDDDWSRGKCAFKAVQMMMCGLPVVASPVGANTEVVQDGVNGYLAADLSIWTLRLSELIESPARRQMLGAAGRASILSRYAVDTWAERLGGALYNVCGRNKT